ncbi:hypothetical protein FQN50_009474 [Emmonsiellopsis sp. PD_5]|nr:hypothetical protein FQN50_009474 [Emmonsiellopsis sp. PD_5]
METATLLSQDHTSLTLNGVATEAAQDSEETLSFNDHHAHVSPKTRRNMSEKDAYSILRKVQKGQWDQTGNRLAYPLEVMKDDHGNSHHGKGSMKRGIETSSSIYDVVEDLDQQETIPRAVCQHHDSKPRDATSTKRKWVFRSRQKSDRGCKPNSAPQLGYSLWPSDVRDGENTAWHNPGELANPVISPAKASGRPKTQWPERSQSLLVQSPARADNHACSHC